MRLSFHPLHLVTRAHLSWFSSGRDDADYLERWRRVPLSYHPGQPTEHWRKHEYCEPLSRRASDVQFQNGASALLSYHFYPTDVMHHTSDFSLAQRPMQVGDRIVQRIHVLRMPGLPIVDVMTCNEVTEVLVTDDAVGFAYATTEAHSEEGEWSARMERRTDGSLWLIVTAVSRPSPREPAIIHPFMRYMQRRAHRRGIAAFRAQINPTA